MTEEKLYYIHNGKYVGNAPLWWGKNHNGYVTDVDKAGLYTEEEAIKIGMDRSSDIPYLKEDVEKAIRKTVDAQFLKQSLTKATYILKREKQKGISDSFAKKLEKDKFEYFKESAENIFDCVWSSYYSLNFMEDELSKYYETAELHYIDKRLHYKNINALINIWINLGFLSKCTSCNKATRDIEDGICEDCYI